MKNIRILALILLLTSAAMAQGTGFNFQGRLNDGANPANGSYDLQFTLYSAITGGAPIGSTNQRPNTALINGVFSVTLDFGPTAFNNPNAVFIEIGVKPAGSPNAFTILGPRQQLTAVPFAVRANNAATADNATNLNGLDSTDFIKNSTVSQEAANFNIGGNGRINGSLGVGVPNASINPDIKLDVQGNVKFRDNFNRSINFGNPNGETGISLVGGTSRADLRLDEYGTVGLLTSPTVTGIPSESSGINVDRFGRIGIGTASPITRLSLAGGPTWSSNNWIASMDLQNGAAIGWRPNATGQRFGIGQSVNGLHFFRTESLFDDANLPARNDMTITNTGNITQPPGKYGLVKAMLYVTPDGNIGQCYNALLNSVTGTCGFIVQRESNGVYTIDLNQPVGGFYSVTSQYARVNVGGIVTSQNVIRVTLTQMTEVGVNLYSDEPVNGIFSLIVY